MVWGHASGLRFTIQPGPSEPWHMLCFQVNLTGIANSKPGKYVDTAINEMINGMKRCGCEQENMVAKICGGSRIFKTSKNDDESIGAKNFKLSMQILKQRMIPIAARDVGGDFERIVEFDVKTG